MQSSRYLPNPEHLSTVSATILLAFALSRFIQFPAQQLRISIIGIIIPFNINAQLITLPIVAFLAAAGADWLIRSHPLWKKKSTIQHWLLPMLTALVLAFPISRLPLGTRWWLSFIVGAVLLMAVLLAEYIIIDPDDARRAVASTALVAVSYAIYFIFAVALHLLGYRLLITFITILFTTFLVSYRSFTLRQFGHSPLVESGLIAIITAQVSSSLHYWPISPVSYGLALLGLSYALMLFILIINTQTLTRKALTEPFILLIIAWITAFWLK